MRPKPVAKKQAQATASMNMSEIVVKSLSELKAAPYNPRRIDESALAGLTKSLERFGYVEPIIWNKRSGYVVGGHQRLKVLKTAKASEVPVVVVDLDELEEKALNVALNNPHIGGEFTVDLAALLDEIRGADEMLFRELRLDQLIAEAKPPELLGDPDDVPEVPKVAKTKPGDLYILGNHRLLCGDSTVVTDVERLMGGMMADLIFTDPPYGVDYDGGHAVKGVRREKLANDGTPDIYAEVLPLAYAFSSPRAALYLWFSDSKSSAVLSAVLSAGYEIRNTLIWNKNQAQFGAIGAQYKSKHEPCLYAFKTGESPYWDGPTNEVSVWDIDREKRNEFHPTQKPIALGKRAIENSCPPAGIVLDFFGGSGSTLIACETTGRSCRTIEMDPLYVDVIVQRWETLTGKKAELSNG